MRIAFGIWVLWSPQPGGIRKSLASSLFYAIFFSFFFCRALTNASLLPDSFLIKDTQDDIAGHRLKA